MEAEDPLSQLADIHLPDTVSLWPPAPGWWLLAALVLLLLCWCGLLLYQRWQCHKRLSRALQELDQATQQFHAANNDNNSAGLELLYKINSLLKRVALVHYPHTDVAALTGNDWTRFLDSCSTSKGFTDGPGSVLADGEYRRQFAADADALQSVVRRWIREQYLRPPRRLLARLNTKGSTQGVAA